MRRWNSGLALAESHPTANDAQKGRWEGRLATALLRTFGIVVVGLFVGAPGLALADEVPGEFLGRWSTRCGDTNAPKIEMAANSIAITVGGKTYRYTGINASRTWYGGVKADGNRVWLPTSKRPGRKFAFVAAPPPSGAEGPMVLEEGVPEESDEIRSIFGAQFRRCKLGLRATAQQQLMQPDGPATIAAGDGQMANCSSGIVRGLKPGGDGFLAVRAGPGTSHRMLDRLHNGESVWLCDQRGDWVGIVYGREDCGTEGSGPEHPYTGSCRAGWAHGRWIELVAGPTSVEAGRGPSFDCARARTPPEQAICESAELSQLDAKMSAVFEAALFATVNESETDAARSAQRDFMAQRDRCGSDSACLTQAYSERLSALAAAASPVLGQEANASGSPSSQTADLAALRGLPAGINSISFDDFNGIPLFGPVDRASFPVFLTLVKLGTMPQFLEQNECTVVRALFTPEFIGQFARPYECAGDRLFWLGADEFATAEARRSFHDKYGKMVLALAPKLPLTIAFVDDIALGLYDEAKTAFPVGGYSNRLGSMGEPSSIAVDLSRDVPTWLNLSFFPNFEWPEPFLPMKSADAARDFIAEVNSWPYAEHNSPMPAATGQRTVRRVTVLEFASFDPKTARLEFSLKAISLHNLDLTRKLYDFPVTKPINSFSSGDIPERLVVASPAPLDEFYLNLRIVGEAGENAPEKVWARLVELVAHRDREFWSRPGKSKEVLSHDNARRPFFGNGEDGAVSIAFKRWAIAYAAGLPDEIELVGDYTNVSIDRDGHYTFQALKANGGPGIYSGAIAAIGLQSDQVVSVGGFDNLLLTLPNRPDFYVLDVDGETMLPFAGRRLLWKAVFKTGPRQSVSAEANKALLLHLEPISLTLEEEQGVEIARQTFEAVPRLDGGFSVDAPASSAGTALFDAPVALSGGLTNTLVAAALDPTQTDDAFEGLVIQRWHLEQKGEPFGGRFFVEGKRLPGTEEARVLFPDFAAWARARIPTFPIRLTIKADVERSPGVDFAGWQSLACISDALTQDDRFRIASNARGLQAAIAQKALAMNGAGSWGEEDELRVAALDLEPVASSFVHQVGCEVGSGPDADPMKIFTVTEASLPVPPPLGEAEKLSAEVTLQINAIAPVDSKPNYLDLLPDDVAAHLFSGGASKNQTPAETFIRMDADLVEVAYHDASGREIARLSADPAATLSGLLRKFEVKSAEILRKPEAGEAYGPDMIGIQLGISFDEAEAIIQGHMRVGRVLTGMRASSGAQPTPATSGKLFISADEREFVAIFDDAPAVEGRVLAAWRRIYLDPEQIPETEVIEGLRSKYGTPITRTIEAGTRNFWSTPAGNDCQSSFNHGGARPALSASWRENGVPANLALPDGRPVPDAMLPMAMVNPLDPSNQQLARCGPVFTAEFSFDASRSVKAGYPTTDRDWIEQIISDVGPYMQAFSASRLALQGDEANVPGKAQTGAAVKF